eukprot:TRINITY_DN70247_c0_g1_i1.p1 TRINITY_DN70247_c0_g1~~TRINITY_DN70247_c0_g1_i1.p1  ORF type:complete len:227 (+),score=33.20 TRINITY_DN70247_c0_g1_i1:54-683(+)
MLTVVSMEESVDMSDSNIFGSQCTFGDQSFDLGGGEVYGADGRHAIPLTAGSGDKNEQTYSDFNSTLQIMSLNMNLCSIETAELAQKRIPFGVDGMLPGNSFSAIVPGSVPCAQEGEERQDFDLIQYRSSELTFTSRQSNNKEYSRQSFLLESLGTVEEQEGSLTSVSGLKTSKKKSDEEKKTLWSRAKSNIKGYLTRSSKSDIPRAWQ